MTLNVEQKPETTRPQSVRAMVSAWLPVALWVGAIQGFAGDGFAEARTSRFIGPMLRWLFPDADQETLDLIHFGIRKSSHAIEYAILALLARRAFGQGFAMRCTRRALWSLALVLAVAIIDESRQAASELRGGAIGDVALDLAGGLMALVGVRWLQRLRGDPNLRGDPKIGAS
jgi:VanZ family protein